jgi:hypothetical protein
VAVAVCLCFVGYNRELTWECVVCRSQKVSDSSLLGLRRSKENCGDFCTWYRTSIDPKHVHDWQRRADSIYNIYGKLTKSANLGRNRLWLIPPVDEMQFLQESLRKDEILLLAREISNSIVQDQLYRAVYSAEPTAKADLLKTLNDSKISPENSSTTVDRPVH